MFGSPKPPQNPLPGARNRPLGPRNEVPEPSRTIPGSAKKSTKQIKMIRNVRRTFAGLSAAKGRRKPYGQPKRPKWSDKLRQRYRVENRNVPRTRDSPIFEIKAAPAAPKPTGNPTFSGGFWGEAPTHRFPISGGDSLLDFPNHKKTCRTPSHSTRTRPGRTP